MVDFSESDSGEDITERTNFAIARFLARSSMSRESDASDYLEVLHRKIYVRALSKISGECESVNSKVEAWFWTRLITSYENDRKFAIKCFKLCKPIMQLAFYLASFGNEPRLANRNLNYQIIQGESGWRTLIVTKETKHQNYLDILVNHPHLKIQNLPCSNVKQSKKNSELSFASLLYHGFRTWGMHGQELEFRELIGKNAISSCLVVEGDGFTDRLVALVSKQFDIPTFCLQWGSFSRPRLKPGFRNLPYSAYLVWGEPFRKQLCIDNENMPIHSVGYLLPLSSSTVGNSKTILFCDQGPQRGLVNPSDRTSLAKLAVRIQNAFPLERIVWREHPSFHGKVHDSIKTADIEISQGGPIVSDLRDSKIVLAIASSVFIECAYTGSIPVAVVGEVAKVRKVWPPEMDAIVRICDTENAFELVTALLSDETLYKAESHQLDKLRSQLLIDDGIGAVERLIQFLASN